MWSKMNRTIDWLNDQIDHLQADRSLLRPVAANKVCAENEDAALLQIAAHLNSLRPGALDPDLIFLASLKARILENVPRGA